MMIIKPKEKSLESIAREVYFLMPTHCNDDYESGFVSFVGWYQTITFYYFVISGSWEFELSAETLVKEAWANELRVGKNLEKNESYYEGFMYAARLSIDLTIKIYSQTKIA